VIVETIDFTYQSEQTRLKEQAYYYGGGDCAVAIAPQLWNPTLAAKTKTRRRRGTRLNFAFFPRCGINNRIATRKPRRLTHV
jgi:hypothetical protein